MGKEIVGVDRTKLVVDEDVKIIKIIDKVKTKDHAQQLIDALEL